MKKFSLILFIALATASNVLHAHDNIEQKRLEADKARARAEEDRAWAERRRADAERDRASAEQKRLRIEQERRRAEVERQRLADLREYFHTIANGYLAKGKTQYELAYDKATKINDSAYFLEWLGNEALNQEHESDAKKLLELSRQVKEHHRIARIASQRQRIAQASIGLASDSLSVIDDTIRWALGDGLDDKQHPVHSDFSAFCDDYILELTKRNPEFARITANHWTNTASTVADKRAFMEWLDSYALAQPARASEAGVLRDIVQSAHNKSVFKTICKVACGCAAIALLVAYLRSTAFRQQRTLDETLRSNMLAGLRHGFSERLSGLQ